MAVDATVHSLQASNALLDKNLRLSSQEINKVKRNTTLVF